MKKIAILVENSRAYGRELILGIARYAQERRDWLLRSVTMAEATPARLKTYDGIIARVADDRQAARLVRSGKPIVDVFGQKAYPGIAGIDTDHFHIGQMARTFFLSRGFENLAFCGIPGATFSKCRGQAFAAAANYPSVTPVRDKVDESIFYAERTDFIPDAEPMRTWLRSLPKPVAVFCCNDLRALQLQRIASESGLKTPEDVAILGVDDDTVLCSFAETPISSINPNAAKIGYDAAKILGVLMEHPPSQKLHQILHIRPGDIIERASTEFTPIKPPWLGNVLIHVERNVGKPITTQEIAALSGRSVTFIERVFNKRLGMSVQVYITSVKMREALKLLADPRLRISEIAYRCGFATPQYFCRTFTTWFGKSPRTIRQKAQWR